MMVGEIAKFAWSLRTASTLGLVYGGILNVITAFCFCLDAESLSHFRTVSRRTLELVL